MRFSKIALVLWRVSPIWRNLIDALKISYFWLQEFRPCRTGFLYLSRRLARYAQMDAPSCDEGWRDSTWQRCRNVHATRPLLRALVGFATRTSHIRILRQHGLSLEHPSVRVNQYPFERPQQPPASPVYIERPTTASHCVPHSTNEIRDRRMNVYTLETGEYVHQGRPNGRSWGRGWDDFASFDRPT